MTPRKLAVLPAFVVLASCAGAPAAAPPVRSSAPVAAVPSTAPSPEPPRSGVAAPSSRGTGATAEPPVAVGRDLDRADAPIPEPIEETFLGCAASGDDRGDEALNLLKNRIDPADQPRAVTFAEFLRLPMPDGIAKRHRAKWSDHARREIAKHEGRPVVIEGFVFDAKKEGPEATNCHEDDERQKDFHVWLIEHAGDDRAAAIVVEITPRVRAHHPSWTLAELKRVAKNRAPVRIAGWLMFDQEHPEQLHATAKHDATRGTLWEVHPVTRFEVEDGKGKQDL